MAEARTATYRQSLGPMARPLALLALLLLGALVFADRSQAEVESPPPPQVWSDKADYVPGETVTLSGASWAPGESVHIRVNDDAGETWRRDVDVVADQNGAFTDQFNLPTGSSPLRCDRYRRDSGTATWSFTDGNVRFDIALDDRRATFVENIYIAATDCTGAVRTNGGFPDKTSRIATVTTSEWATASLFASMLPRPLRTAQRCLSSPWSTTDSSPFTVIAGTDGLSACFRAFRGTARGVTARPIKTPLRPSPAITRR